mgnify:CR=1 FL=1
MKIDEGVNWKIHAKVRQMLNSKAENTFKKEHKKTYLISLSTAAEAAEQISLSTV